jgi:hypothetical protein
MRTTPTDVVQMLFPLVTDMKRYSVHSTTHPDPRDAATPIAAKELADDGPAAAGEAHIFGVAKRYGKP